MEVVEKLEEFIRGRYYSELLKAIKEDKALVIDFSTLDRFDPILADNLLLVPDEMTKHLNSAAENIARSGSETDKVIVRVRNIPESRNIRIRNLRAKHMNKLWTIDAVIKSASEVKPQIFKAVFQCPECNTDMELEQDTLIMHKPTVCDGCGRRGDFKLIEKKMFDVRWLSGTEPFEITSGEQPGEIAIFLKEDLTVPSMQRKSDPGARLKIIGILKELPKRIKGKLSTKLDMYVDALYFEPGEIEFEEIEISEDDEKKIKELARDPLVYEKLKASVAPTIYGFDEIKEALVLQMVGGVPHYLPDGTRIRGSIHILLTGDPGIGKTVLLKLIASIMPRGKYVSGSGVTGAGLTATVRKDEILGGWLLEAGALILANKSIIGIDEFDKMSRDDQIAMHEAMSVETVSIAKASIVASLPAQTSVLAGANPKLGRFDPLLSIPEQIQIPETLLSRFDLKFALRDRPDKTMDEKLAEHIITSRTNPELVSPTIELNLLRKFLAYAKQINELELTEEASKVMKDFYVEMRNRYVGEEIQTISITLRQYEALLRLAEASAKIRLDDKIIREDAERSIKLMKYSLSQLGYDYETGRIDIDRMETGISASRRRKITIVMDLLESMQKIEKEIAVEDLKAAAEEKGIEEIEDILERLKSEGTIFEPRPGYIRKI